MESPFTKKEKNWILYDVACSAFTLLSTALITFYLAFLHPDSSNPDFQTTPIMSTVNIIITVLAVILCPIMGTYADFSKKRNVFMIFASIGIVGCTLLSVSILIVVSDTHPAPASTLKVKECKPA